MKCAREYRAVVIELGLFRWNSIRGALILWKHQYFHMRTVCQKSPIPTEHPYSYRTPLYSCMGSLCKEPYSCQNSPMFMCAQSIWRALFLQNTPIFMCVQSTKLEEVGVCVCVYVFIYMRINTYIHAHVYLMYISEHVMFWRVNIGLPEYFMFKSSGCQKVSFHESLQYVPALHQRLSSRVHWSVGSQNISCISDQGVRKSCFTSE